MDEKQSSVIRLMWFTYTPYWPLFLLLFLAAGGGAFIYLKYARHYYGIGARILIKDENKGASEAKVVESLDAFSTKKIIENEVEVIQSRSLIGKVVESLHLYATIRPENDNGRNFVSPVSIQARYPDRIVLTDEINFSYFPFARGISMAGHMYPVNQWVDTPYGTLRFVPAKNGVKLQEEFALRFVLKDIKSVVSSIKSRLNVRPVSRSSSVLELSYRDESPQQGEEFLDGLMLYYNITLSRDKDELIASTLGFVEDRLQKVAHELDSIEQTIQKYRYTNGVIDVSTQGRIFLENVSSVDQKLSDVGMQLAILDQVEKFVQSKDKNASVVPSTLGVADPMLSQLVAKLYTAELEYESLKKTTAENNPMLVSVADQIASIKPSILENIESQRRSLKASQENLSATSTSYVSMLKSLPKTEKDLIDINRQQHIKSEIYNFLLQKREETALSQAAVVSNGRIIDPAQASEHPVSPKPKVVYLSAFLLALLSGVGIVAARETLNSSVLFRGEIERSTRAPIIGEIAQESSGKMVVIADERRSFIAEQFRSLRTSLGYLGITDERKRIMVTSSISGEGKSFVAVNLAVTLALTGKRVALIDLDLNINGPTINQKLQLEAHSGVTEFLQGKAEIKDIVLKTDFADSLYLISKGKLTKNPTELLLNGRVEHMLHGLNEMFDYVVIDTPPVGMVTDAYLVSRYCDATLYIVRHGYTPKLHVSRIDSNNKINKLNNLAIVFNGVQPRGFGSRKYGYGYGYGYITREKNNARLKPQNA